MNCEYINQSLFANSDVLRVRKEFPVKIDGGANLVSEAFGLTDGYIQKICDIEIPTDFSVLFITGDSGSGKTTIATSIFPNYLPPQIPQKPLYLWNGETTEQQQEAIRVFCMCGLSDAIQFVSLYENLSDSQKARAAIAKQILDGRKTIVVDEFLSTLDRKTAKATAYSLQKSIRKSGLKLVAITSHDDLIDYLMPDVIIRGKAFPSRFMVEQTRPDTEKNPVLANIKFHYGDKTEYKYCDLGLLHYKGKYTGGTKEYLFATDNGEIVGVMVSTYNRSTGGRRISRVVVHPSYRGTGIGVALVRKYLADYPDTDVVAAMALFNPIFGVAGMERTTDSVVKSPHGLAKEISQNGFEISRWHDRSYCSTKCADPDFRAIVAKYSKHASDLVCPGGKKLTNEEICKKILDDEVTAGRVLFGLRDKRMAKYVNNPLRQEVAANVQPVP